MQAKYIVILQRGLECMIIFPEIMKHDQIALGLTGHKMDCVISAGFVRMLSSGQVTCYGCSISVDKESRIDVDTRLAEALLSDK